MIAPTANPDVLLVLLAKSKEVFPIHTRTNVDCVLGRRAVIAFDSCSICRCRLMVRTCFVSNNNHAAFCRAP